MGRKIVFVVMIAVLLAGTIHPARTYAVWSVIGSTVVKESIKHVTKSQMVRSGIKASNKSALERAHEAWFSRFTAEQVAAIEQAAARAVPSGTPGWLKVAVGLSLWATGLDLALEIWDAIQGGDEVIFPTNDTSYGRVIGAGGLVLKMERYDDGTYQSLDKYYVRIGTPLGDVHAGDYAYGYYVTDLSQFGVSGGGKVAFDPKSQYHNPNDVDFRVDWQYHVNGVRYVSVTIIFNSAYTHGSSPFRRQFWTLIKYSLLSDNVPRFSDIQNVPYIASPMPGVTYVPTASPAIVPNPHPDIFPDDSQAVEILVPDPSVWKNPDDAIWQNMDYIRQDVTEPITENQPDLPDWADPTPPSAYDWAERLYGVVSTRFPFSLPWDLYRLLSLFAEEPERPHIRINQDLMGMPFRLEVDFSFLDPYMPFFRGVIIVGFCVGLIMITRRIMGGGT